MTDATASASISAAPSPTSCCSAPTARIHTKKISSSVDDYARAIVEGLSELFAETGLAGARDRGDPPRHDRRLQRHPRAQGRADRADHHQGLPRRAGDPHAAHAPALRPRLGEAAAAGRALPAPGGRRAGRRTRPRSSARSIRRDAERAVDALLAEKVEAIAVCLLNSYANPRARADAARRSSRARRPDLQLSVSFEVLPEIKEYERTSTTVINAYVMPIVATYLRALRQGLDGGGHPGAPAADAVQRRPDQRRRRGRAADEHHRVRPGRRRRRRAGAGARQGARRSHHLRHGRHDRQGLDRRGRRGDARARIRGRRRHHDRLAAADGRRLHAEGAGDRPRRGRRRRRLACLDRRRRRAAGRAAERRRLARAGLLRPGRRRRRPSPTPTSCSATSTRRIWSAAR